MPNVATTLLTAVPLRFRHNIGNCAGCVILVASHYLQNTVSIVGNSIKTNELVRHRDGQQRGGDSFPIVDRFVIEVSPMEIVIRIELSVRSGIRKITSFFRVHCYKHLNEREQSGKNALK